MRRVSFFKTELAGGLASRLDWAASSSREVTEWLNWTFCPVMLQLAWRFSFSACLARVQLLAACKPRATHEIQSRVPASLHNLKHFFTLSHTLPLHDSRLNTGLLIVKIHANLARNKANKMVDKIQPYSYTHISLHICLWISSTPTSLFPYHWEVDSLNTYHTLSECQVRIWCCWEALEEARLWWMQSGVLRDLES